MRAPLIRQPVQQQQQQQPQPKPSPPPQKSKASRVGRAVGAAPLDDPPLENAPLERKPPRRPPASPLRVAVVVRLFVVEVQIPIRAAPLVEGHHQCVRVAGHHEGTPTQALLAVVGGRVRGVESG